ncbi:hypothetical protein [Sporolactobacillus terrae]|uniref:hypothetical protein n=1 Tax=Sporolactobacillus terrae TaxID=269673 RepID=UPI00048F2549|nr:hypothetical protein [Sporolactobacillus terrae]
MGIVFATCEVNRGLEFINKMYPSHEDLAKEDVPLLCDLLKEDVLRVQDPDFHQPCQIILGDKGNMVRDKGRINEAVKQLMNHPKLAD